MIPGFPDQDGRASKPPNLLGREPAMQMLKKAGGSRVAIYSLEKAAGTPIYVHAKVCIIDDTWACVGSDNANRRSWTHDSELNCAVLDTTSERTNSWAHSVRLELAREHLGDQRLPNISTTWCKLLSYLKRPRQIWTPGTPKAAMVHALLVICAPIPRTLCRGGRSYGLGLYIDLSMTQTDAL